MSEPLLRLDRVSKRYGALKVTDNLSFSLAEGEALGVLGPNGAGKSTMFNLITGDVRPDAGQVFYGGHDITLLAPSARCCKGIGRSYQVPHPLAGMTVFENLVVAVAVIGALQFVFARTALGRSLRATSDDPEIVQLMAVDSRKIYAVAMGIASATVALAGVFLGMTKAFDPLLGPPQLLFAFEAVIIGGLGSLWGTLAGGMVLGVAQAVGFRVDPGWGILFGHLAFFAVLLLRPQGLFPKTRDH